MNTITEHKVSADYVALYLDVPFREKDDAKAAGARWDQERRLWYITRWVQAEDYHKFIRWMPKAVKKLLEKTKRDPHAAELLRYSDPSMTAASYYSQFNPISTEDKWLIVANWHSRLSRSLTDIRLKIAEEVLNRPEFIIDDKRLQNLSYEFMRSAFWNLHKVCKGNLHELDMAIQEVSTVMHTRDFWFGASEMTPAKSLYYLALANNSMVNCLDIPERLKIQAETMPDELWTSYEQLSYDQIHEDNPLRFDEACSDIDTATGLAYSVTDIVASYLWPFLDNRSMDGKTRVKSKKRPREEEEEKKDDSDEPDPKRATRAQQDSDMYYEDIWVFD